MSFVYVFLSAAGRVWCECFSGSWPAVLSGVGLRPFGMLVLGVPHGRVGAFSVLVSALTGLCSGFGAGTSGKGVELARLLPGLA